LALVQESSADESDDNTKMVRVSSGKTNVMDGGKDKEPAIGKKRQQKQGDSKDHLKSKITDLESETELHTGSTKRLRAPDIPLFVAEMRPPTEAAKKKEASRVIPTVVSTKAADEGVTARLYPVTPRREPLLHVFTVPENVVCEEYVLNISNFNLHYLFVHPAQ